MPTRRPTNRAPVAVLTIPTTTVAVQTPVTFDGRGSYDPDGAIKSWVFTFGDGARMTGNGQPSIVQHPYSASGVYDVTLTVTDRNRVSASDTKRVLIIGQQAPIVGLALQGVVGDVWTFSTAGTTDPDGIIASWSFDPGNGSGPVTGSGNVPATFDATYLIDNTYTVSLTVIDNDGHSGSASLQVIVSTETQSPIAVLAYVSGQYATQVWTVSTAGTSDLDGTIVSYSMDWGIGSPDTGSGAPPVYLTHTYAVAGTYTQRLTVTDNDGLVGFTERVAVVVTLPVNPVPPTARLVYVSGTYVNDLFTVSTAGTSDPNGGVLTGTLAWGDGTTQPYLDGTSTYTHTYTASQSYTVTLTVTNNVPLTATATTSFPVQSVLSFYVDASRTTNGNGSAANPWKERGDIVWASIASALATGAVTIYFSSRASWTNTGYLTVPSNTNVTTNRLTLDGQTKYNTVTSGSAVWQLETISTNLARFDQTVIVDHNVNNYITIRGFKITGAASGGIVLGQNNPTVNMHDLIVENNIVDTPVTNQGIWWGFAETGCYNLIVRNNTVIATPSESIYIGHFSYLANTITGVVVENNTILNAGGPSQQGDIDLKGGTFGAIVRYNTSYSTGTGQVLGGIVIQSSDTQVYGNQIYNLKSGINADGEGITINADGDGAGNGKAIANTLVYNNLIYTNYGNGISTFATATGASISGLKVLNNTVVGETNGHGFHASASGPGTIAVTALANNIFSTNSLFEVWTTAGVTIAFANYNAIYHPAGGTYLQYQGVGKSYAQWQGLGFDANGLNVDPQLNATTYRPASGASPIIGVGQTRAEFSVDKTPVARTVPWTIGAYQNP